MADWEEGGFGLYIHWPFCEALCPYCDFNSYVAASIDQDRWCAAFVSEIDRVAAELPDRVLNSVFFGGGTPSLMAPQTVSNVLNRVFSHWSVANDVEVTLEANPSSVEAGRFQEYRAAGINRVSLGVQALNDQDLKRLGRLHTAHEALAAMEIARNTFERVSFDLIYARQDQSLKEWREELRTALAFGGDHLSLYQLTIEPGTAFGARHARGGLTGLPGEDLAADLFEVTQELCNSAGLPAYETSNHARDLAASRHNLIYWRSGDYAGVGPGAHGRVTLGGVRFATETILTPGGWLKAVETDGSGENSRTPLSNIEHSEEFLMMGLRLAEGVDLRRYNAMSGHRFDQSRIQELLELKFVEMTEDRLAVTPKGRPILNAILREILV